MNTDTDTENRVVEPEKPEPLNLSVDVQEKRACERHVTVTVSRDDIERYFSKQFDEIVPQAEIPGFRTGRAPRKLIEKRFRKQVAEQVKGSILMDSLTQATDSKKFSAISEPDLDFEQVNIPDDGDLTYEFNIEVRPEFDLPPWEGLTLERPEHEFTESDVDEYIYSVVSEKLDLVPVDEPIQKGDYAVCNVTSSFEGKPVSKLEEVLIPIRPTLSLADGTIEDFDQLMIGARAGDTKTVSVEVSEFSDNEALREKTVEVAFEILDVKREDSKTIEEIAELFDVESTELLRAESQKILEDHLQYEQREKVREQIRQMLTESADWELPPDLLRRQAKRELERAVMEMRSSSLPEQEIMLRENALRKNILERTEKLLKEHFILERIAETEEIEATPEEIETEIAKIAISQGDSPRRVRAQFERGGQMDALRNMIIEQKVIDRITDKATFKALPYQLNLESDLSAIDFFAGGTVSAIPEAKYEGGDQAPIPGVKTGRS